MVFVMSWVSKSAKNLLPLSREKQDFQKALISISQKNATHSSEGVVEQE
jgi:hypothetical protein